MGLLFICVKSDFWVQPPLIMRGMEK